LRLGGAHCVDATALMNVELLWRSIDKLAAGEPDLLGTALDAALDKLTAQPDPEADSDYGVQLMTIHKSKGLEFEVVIVPELHAGARRGKHEMLSWLERGLPPEGDAGDGDYLGEITEFLVAPVQSKGTERGNAKAWVDRVRIERESQELRRLLYVAATRAREELHLFAQPSFTVRDDGSFELMAPSNNLLATAWPALEADIRERFEAWRASASAREEQTGTLESIAASAGDGSDASGFFCFADGEQCVCTRGATFWHRPLVRAPRRWIAVARVGQSCARFVAATGAAFCHATATRCARGIAGVCAGHRCGGSPDWRECGAGWPDRQTGD
jgi:hypothetical protein